MAVYPIELLSQSILSLYRFVYKNTIENDEKIICDEISVSYLSSAGFCADNGGGHFINGAHHHSGYSLEECRMVHHQQIQQFELL